MISEFYTLKKWITESDNIVCITGRDFSKEAGFPDYRIMEEGFLDTYRYTPQEILKVSFLQRYPFFFYKFFRDRMLQPMLEAKPSFAHETLAKLEQAGKLKAILTVNIDGIHQEADSRNVLELRGSHAALLVRQVREVPGLLPNIPRQPHLRPTATWICAATSCARPSFWERSPMIWTCWPRGWSW